MQSIAGSVKEELMASTRLKESVSPKEGREGEVLHLSYKTESMNFCERLTLNHLNFLRVTVTSICRTMALCPQIPI